MKTRKPGRPYPDVAVFIGDGSNSERGERLPVVNSASDETIGEVPKTSRFGLDRAVASGEARFAQWNKMPPLGRENPEISRAAGKPCRHYRAHVHVRTRQVGVEFTSTQT
jgi:acyl-CoA reductase-like NAD-dependent aldehyde dehydrogenase